jgi:hypothetical protein
VSDNFQVRPFPGYGQHANRHSLAGMLPKRRLVEECEAVYIYAVQQVVGKKALLKAIRENRPLVLSIRGGPAEIWLTYESHQLPGERGGWSQLEDGTARLWFSCPGCRRMVAKLYYYLLPGSSPLRSDLLCRYCHRLTYRVNNVGGNRWYRQFARPLKRLLRRRAKLLGGRRSAKVPSWLPVIDGRIKAYQEALAPKPSRRRRTLPASRRERRRYRDAGSLLDPLPPYFPNGDLADVRRDSPTGKLSDT